jgi:hypothetical protein
MMVNGMIIICMVLEYIHGKMVEDMKVIIKWIKNMEWVHIHGQMEESKYYELFFF